MKKLFILTLAVLSLVACEQANQPAAATETQQSTQMQQPVKTQKVQVSRNYLLPIEKYNFNEKINEKPVVIAFMAGFCGWCKKMVPYMDELAGKVPSYKADVIIGFMDDNAKSLSSLDPVKNTKNISIYYGASPLMQQHGVNSFPTIMLFKNGKLVETWRGYSPDHVQSILNRLED